MRLAILFGGNSYEHEISIVSAIVLKKVLCENLIFIFCDQRRKFYLIPKEKMNVKNFITHAYEKEVEVFLKNECFYQKTLVREKKIHCDCIINLIHGRDGEDGKIASLFEFFDIKFIGPKIEASVISFNKEYTKLYAQSIGVKTLAYNMLRKNEEQGFIVHFPCILKPARLGSSIGISVVKDEEEFDYAKDVAFEFDEDILVEEFKHGLKEYNLAGCMIENEFVFSIIEEPKKKEFLDFEQKYLSFSNSDKSIEANLSEELKEKLKDNFKKIYNPLFKGALIRCDFFIIDEEIYLNEINPNPGSLAHYLFEDFNKVIKDMALNVENEKKIKIAYNFLHSIKGQKAKL